MRARLIVISRVSGKHTAQVAPRQKQRHDPGIRGAACRSSVRQCHSAMAIQEMIGRSRMPIALDPGGEDVSVGPVIVTNQVGRCRCPGERLGDLPRKPLRRRMPGHLKPQQLPSTVANDQEGKQSDQRSPSGPHTDRSRRSHRRDCAERSASSATAAFGRASCISRPSTEPPRSPASTARRGSGTRPTTGFPGSSAGSSRADLGQSSAALPSSSTSSANRL